RRHPADARRVWHGRQPDRSARRIAGGAGSRWDRGRAESRRPPANGADAANPSHPHPRGDSGVPVSLDVDVLVGRGLAGQRSNDDRPPTAVSDWTGPGWPPGGMTPESVSETPRMLESG